MSYAVYLALYFDGNRCDHDDDDDGDHRFILPCYLLQSSVIEAEHDMSVAVVCMFLRHGRFSVVQVSQRRWLE